MRVRDVRVCALTEGDEVVVGDCRSAANDCAEVIGCRHPCERGETEKGQEK